MHSVDSLPVNILATDITPFTDFQPPEISSSAKHVYSTINTGRVCKIEA